MTETLTTPVEAEATAATKPCPPDIPRKFWDEEAGSLRVDGLLKSYQALERRLSQAEPALSAQSAPTRPDRPEDYRIDIAHGLFEPDPEVNQQLFNAGFSQEQAQLLYDLAASELLPIAREISELYRSEFERERLESYFGGPDRWREVSRQIRKWGRAHLPSDAFEALASSYEGILAMHKMMGQTDEPGAFADGESASGLAEKDLRQMMRSPRYWQDRDPGVITKVTEGFRRLYNS